MFLLLDILLDDAQGSTTCCADKIGIRPQRGQFSLEFRELLSQASRGTTFDEFHQPMDPKLGVHIDQEMHMIWHHL